LPFSGAGEEESRRVSVAGEVLGAVEHGLKKKKIALVDRHQAGHLNVRLSL